MKEYYTQERCWITELSNSQDDEALSIARARVELGVVTRWHKLAGTTERYVMLQGEGLVEVGEQEPRVVGPGDVVVIAADSPQRIANIGEGELVFLAICSPRFQQVNYRDLGDEL